MNTFTRPVGRFGMATVLALAMVLTASAMVPGPWGNGLAQAQEEGRSGVKAEAQTARVSGRTRVETSAAAAREAFPEGADAAVLARGDAFPDALAAASLAGSLQAPVLLAGGDRLSDVVEGVLADLGVQQVILLGGRQALAPGIAHDLADLGVDTTRISGDDRYETAAQVARATQAERATSPDVAFLANGGSYPDALAAGPISYADRRPLLLTSREQLPAPTQAAIQDLGIGRVVVLGGGAAVSRDVEAALADAGVDVERVGGADRFETAVRLAQHGLEDAEMSPRTSVLASGNGFPDALVAGSYAGQLGAPVVLTASSSKLGAATGEWLADHCEEIEHIRALGGPTAISESVIGDAQRRAEQCTPHDGSADDGSTDDGDLAASWQKAWESDDQAVLDAWFEANTGHEACGYTDSDLTDSGSVTTSKAGQVIEGKRITGRVNIEHADVTVRCNEIVPTGSHGAAIDLDDDRQNLRATIEYNSFDNPDMHDGQDRAIYVRWGDHPGTTIRFNKIPEGSAIRGFRNLDAKGTAAEPILYEYNYIRDAQPQPDSGGRVTGWSARTDWYGNAHIIARRNNIRGSGSGVVTMWERGAPQRDITLEENVFELMDHEKNSSWSDNWYDCGGSTGLNCGTWFMIRFDSGSRSDSTGDYANISVVNNKFGRGVFPAGGRGNPMEFFPSGDGNEQAGNQMLKPHGGPSIQLDANGHIDYGSRDDWSYNSTTQQWEYHG